MVGAGFMAASLGAQVIGGLVGGGAARARARAAARQAKKLKAELTSLENSRQAIVNPYETTKDLSYMATNPFANLGVATKAAEFEAEQIDISLANTLDVIKTTGGSGSATALANAALKAKQGISADIEKQEADNEKLRAQGEQDLQKIKMEEKARIQTAEAAGKTFMFNARESREQQKIDRTATALREAQAQAMQGRADQMGALSGMLGGITQTLGSFAKANTPQGADPSDRRLKENIIKIGKSKSGINIYSFEYKDKKFGEGVYQGVMSDEILKDAVIKDIDGYDRVNYSLLDVEFKRIK